MLLMVLIKIFVSAIKIFRNTLITKFQRGEGSSGDLSIMAFGGMVE